MTKQKNNFEDMKNIFNISRFSQLKENETIDGIFQTIAEDLFNKYCIKKGNTTYEFLEIEFYLYTQNHPDIITYPRNAKAGDWFFHQSGVDICFNTLLKKGENIIDENGNIIIPIPEDVSFGGILIRSLLKKDEKNNYVCVTGPLNSCYELFDQFSAISKNNNQYPHLEYKEEIGEKRIAIPTIRYLNFSKEINRFKYLIKLYDVPFSNGLKKDENKIKGSKQYDLHNDFKGRKYRFYREDFTKDIKNINSKKSTKKYLIEVNLQQENTTQQ